jgi:uncharacterized membrane protein
MILGFYAYQNCRWPTPTPCRSPAPCGWCRWPLGAARADRTLCGSARPWSASWASDHAAAGLRRGGRLARLAAGRALASALLFALTITGMKVMTRDHSPFVLLVYAAVLGLVFAIPPALFVWRWPSLPDLGLLAADGRDRHLDPGAYIKGMEAGEAAVMAPIDYTRLVFAVGAGLLLFHEARSRRC